MYQQPTSRPWLTMTEAAAYPIHGCSVIAETLGAKLNQKTLRMRVFSKPPAPVYNSIYTFMDRSNVQRSFSCEPSG
jgi:hypothetical protein